MIVDFASFINEGTSRETSAETSPPFFRNPAIIQFALLIKNLIVFVNEANHFNPLSRSPSPWRVLGAFYSGNPRRRGRDAEMSTEIALPGGSSRDVIELREWMT
ncbi:hypothetical protein NPIL_80851 [Nephila pilipes]|uniref:Uncharacterized protein n=1 Tax=Nephila pilipes TaxID=299642 RepID=A0A8X6IFB4_NEPPI|nr:hypothetical protein NPIL_80851 [Nephila pilipes]